MQFIFPTPDRDEYNIMIIIYECTDETIIIDEKYPYKTILNGFRAHIRLICLENYYFLFFLNHASMTREIITAVDAIVEWEPYGAL